VAGAILRNCSIGYVNAIQRKVMTMQNWIHILDGFITMSRQDVLTSAGKISADLAEKKAQSEYEKYRENNIEELSEVQKYFFDSINLANKKISNNWENPHMWIIAALVSFLGKITYVIFPHSYAKPA